MCKNIFWRCIFCAAKIRHSAIPDPCNKALITGYECLPHHQEQWSIPSYSLCPTCKEERKPRRRPKVPASVPMMVSETLEGEQMKENYIWNWIPTPMTNVRLSQPVERGDERCSRECEGDEGSNGLGLLTSDTTGLSRQLCMTVTGEQGNEGSSLVGGSLQESRPASTAGSSHNQSFIPVPVHRAQGQRMVWQVGGQQSNIPVPRNTSRGVEHQSLMILSSSPAITSRSGKRAGRSRRSSRSRGIGLGVDGFDWEHFDRITF